MPSNLGIKPANGFFISVYCEEIALIRFLSPFDTTCGEYVINNLVRITFQWINRDHFLRVRLVRVGQECLLHHVICHGGDIYQDALFVDFVRFEAIFD